MKSLLFHGALLAVASVVSLGVWTRDEEGDAPKTATVEVWGGSPEAVESVSYETKQRKVRLEKRTDEAGRWYVARFEKQDEAPFVHPPIDGAPTPPPPPPGPRQTQTFVAVKAADVLVQSLAPLQALRAVGKVAPARAAEFGLDKPEGTLRLRIGGKEQVLTVGAPTPGGGERYAKYAASGEVFAISSELTDTLVAADTRLMERDLHGFSEDEVTRVRLLKGGKQRELVRVADKKDAWADAATPTKADETLVNWMTKLSRVRVTEYVEKPTSPLSPDAAVIRVEYLAGSRPLGYLELYKQPGQQGASDYLARTEYVRWPAKVLASAAEQVDRDLASVLK